MTRSIYDDPDFFAGYSRLDRSIHGLDGAPEWPAMRALLPRDLRGLRVLDLGCGFGWFCRWARAEGAAEVLGIDLSERMLARARADTADPGVTYLRADLADCPLPEARFDLAWSALALHYLADPAPLLGRVHRALVPGGRSVFSTEHPVYTAPARPGWVVDAEGRRTWPVDRYLVEGPRVTDWLAPGVVKHHRTLGTTLTLLIRAGFAIAHVEEFCPTAAQIAARPALEEERDRPMFLLVAADRRP
jgi:SAM-dependent methyltransferase